MFKSEGKEKGRGEGRCPFISREVRKQRLKNRDRGGGRGGEGEGEFEERLDREREKIDDY